MNPVTVKEPFVESANQSSRFFPPSALPTTPTDFNYDTILSCCNDIECDSFKFNVDTMKRLMIDMLSTTHSMDSSNYICAVSRMISTLFVWRVNCLAQPDRSSCSLDQLNSIINIFKKHFVDKIELLSDVIKDQFQTLILPDARISRDQIFFVLYFFEKTVKVDPYFYMLKNYLEAKLSTRSVNPLLGEILIDNFLNSKNPTLQAFNELISILRLSNRDQSAAFRCNTQRLQNVILHIIHDRKIVKFITFENFLKNTAYLFPYLETECSFNLCQLFYQLYQSITDSDLRDLEFAKYWVDQSKESDIGPIGLLYFYIINEESLTDAEMKSLMSNFELATAWDNQIGILFMAKIHLESRDEIATRLFRLMKFLFLEINPSSQFNNFPKSFHYLLCEIINDRTLQEEIKVKLLYQINFLIPNMEEICEQYLKSYIHSSLVLPLFFQMQQGDKGLQGIFDEKKDIVGEIFPGDTSRCEQLTVFLNTTWAEALSYNIRQIETQFKTNSGFTSSMHHPQWSFMPLPTTLNGDSILRWYSLKRTFLKAIVNHYDTSSEILKPTLLKIYTPLVNLRVFNRGTEPRLSTEKGRLGIVEAFLVG